MVVRVTGSLGWWTERVRQGSGGNSTGGKRKGIAGFLGGEGDFGKYNRKVVGCWLL